MKLLGIKLNTKYKSENVYSFNSKYEEFNSYFTFNMCDGFISYLMAKSWNGHYTEFYVKSCEPNIMLQVMLEAIQECKTNPIIKQQFEDLFQKELLFL